jgi:2-methylisocitrate lyase-like PEP mutase family enzyme
MGWADADLAGQGSDAVIDAVIAWGDVDKIAARVRQHLDAGADHVCVQVVAEEEDDVALPQLRELAPALLGL